MLYDNMIYIRIKAVDFKTKGRRVLQVEIRKFQVPLVNFNSEDFVEKIAIFLMKTCNYIMYLMILN